MLHARFGGQTPPIAMGFIAPTFEPFLRLEARIARFVSRFDTTKERFEGQINPFQRDLGRLRMPGSTRLVGVPQRRQIPALLGIGHRMSLAFPGSPALLQGRVVQQAMGFTLLLQGVFLGWSRIQAIGGFAVYSIHSRKSTTVSVYRAPRGMRALASPGVRQGNRFAV
jgi:hypothetical protein